MTTTARVVLPTPEPRRRRARQDGQVVTINVEQDDQLLLTVVEAAHRLRISRSLLFELLAAGEIRSIQVGRLRRVPVDALTDFVRAREQTTA